MQCLLLLLWVEVWPLLQEHAAIHAALGLKPGEGGLGRTFTPEPTILQELQLVEERIAGLFLFLLLLSTAYSAFSSSALSFLSVSFLRVFSDHQSTRQEYVSNTNQSSMHEL